MSRAGVGVALTVTLAAAACARIEPPPGGPPDVAPPQLVAVRPDSFATLPGFKDHAEFQFDEVISEGGSPNQGTGTGDLEKLIILSPSVRVPKVSWGRTRIEVRPAEGWQPNRVYRVELLPGVTDLRRNRTADGAVLTFSTGAPRPATTLDGTVVDWTSSRPAANALVEAILLPDSLPYRALADSSGRFRFGPLPGGDYIVRGVIDENRNLRADPREAYDSVRLAPGKTSAGELWAFVHDTTPIRIRGVTVADSVAAAVELTQHLDPRQRLAVGQVTVRLLPDSSVVPVTSLLPKPLDDSLHQRAPAPRDSTARDTSGRAPGARQPAGRDSARAGAGRPAPAGRPADTNRAVRADSARDTTRVKRPGLVEVVEPSARGAVMLTSRPPLTDRVVVRVARPWRPGTRYEIEIRALRNVTGAAGEVRGVLAVPAAPRPDSATGRAADSLQRRPPNKRS